MAQTPAEQRGKQIVDQAVEALGGNAFLALEDRTETGRAYSYYRDEISGLSIAKIYTRYITVAPDKTGELQGQRERQVFGKNEDSSVLFTEDGAWEITWRGAKELPKDRLDRYRETLLRNIFYILRQRLHERGMIFEFRGSDVFDNHAGEHCRHHGLGGPAGDRVLSPVDPPARAPGVCAQESGDQGAG